MSANGGEPVLLHEQPSEGVHLLRLHRRARRNALNLTLRRELARSLDTLAGDAYTRCVVLAGDEHAFCAGADLDEYHLADPMEIEARGMGALWDAVAHFPKALIAAVEGPALGGGCELAMHADIIVAGEGARFGQPELLVGLVPGGGATQRLPRLVGRHVAMQMFLTGETLDAERAAQLGLVSTLVAQGFAVRRALDLAAGIAALPEFAVRQVKALVRQSMNSALDAGLASERLAFQLMFASADKTRRIGEFLLKRSTKATM